jgi:hypothetical protein
MPSFHEESLTGQRCYARDQNFSSRDGKRVEAPSYISRDGLVDLYSALLPELQKKFSASWLKILVTSLVHGKFAAELVDHSVSFASYVLSLLVV